MHVTPALPVPVRRPRPLTARRVAALKPGAKLRRVPDGTIPWLTLSVHPGGRKSWTLGYRVGTRQRMWTMGIYPVLGLAEARKKAKRALNNLSEHGIDPAVVKGEMRTQQTFGEIAAAFLKRGTGRKGRALAHSTLTEYARILTKDVLPTWEHRPVKTISRRDVVRLVGAIGAGEHRDDGTPVPVMANRTLAVISAVLSYAVKDEQIPFNPAVRLDIKVEEQSRRRVLTEPEIRTLWAACEAAKAPRAAGDPPPVIRPIIAIGLQLVLATAQRPGEVFTMRWTDLDLDPHGKHGGEWWTIPDTVAKNRQEHRVPLIPRALALLCEAQALGPADSPWVFAGEQGGSVAARAKKAIAALREAEAITFEVHRHDLRRTAATNMTADEVPRSDVAFVLNHTHRDAPAVTEVYDCYAYDKEKRHALTKWAHRLDAILTPADAAAKVLTFTA